MRPPAPIRACVHAALLAACVFAASSALAQPPPRRAGEERTVVVELAYTLGEAHALRRLCAGPADATWYSRMQQLEAEEGDEDASRAQLVEAFNSGYAASRAAFPACSRRSRAAERAVAAHGSTLAARLAGP